MTFAMSHNQFTIVSVLAVCVELPVFSAVQVRYNINICLGQYLEFHRFNQMRVLPILDRCVRPPWEEFGNFRSCTAELFILPAQSLIFLGRLAASGNCRLEIMHIALTALPS
jgi:hypothetical protein